MIYNIYDGGIDICLFVCLFVCLFQYRYVPCMVYLPTFTPKNHPNLGKSTIHGACGICHDMFFHGILKPHAGHGPHLVRWRRGHPQSRRSPENHGKTRGKPGEKTRGKPWTHRGNMAFERSPNENWGFAATTSSKDFKSPEMGMSPESRVRIFSAGKT